MMPAWLWVAGNASPPRVARHVRARFLKRREAENSIMECTINQAHRPTVPARARELDCKATAGFVAPGQLSWGPAIAPAVMLYRTVLRVALSAYLTKRRNAFSTAARSSCWLPWSHLS